jgi:hypothetical protein
MSNDKRHNQKKEYDRSVMQHKDNILRFEWGDFPAIGIKHFEERRDERTKRNGTDIFDKMNLTDEEVLLDCFKILKRDKYKYILDTIAKNKPKHTEWVVKNQTQIVLHLNFNVPPVGAKLSGWQGGQGLSDHI